MIRQQNKWNSMKVSTDRECAAVRTDKHRQDFRVGGVPGLYLRVTKSGHKTWTLRYRTGGNRERRLTLGTYPETKLAAARHDAISAINDVNKGEDPSADRAALRAGKTFADLFAYWYDRHAKRKLDAHVEELSRYTQHLDRHLGKLPMADFKRADVATMRDYVFDNSGPVQSNRCLALVNRILNFALEEDLIEANPAARMRKAGKEKPRERVLSDEEIIKLWRELAEAEAWQPQIVEGTADKTIGTKVSTGAMGRPLSLGIIRCIRLLLLTGQRRAEVIETQIAELALSDKQPMWTIASDRAKNDLPHRVPLAPMAAFEMRRAVADAHTAAPANSNGVFVVFPSPANWREPIGPAAVTKAMHRLCKRIGIERAGPHDLRRTVGTGLAKLRVTPDIRSLVLNHTRGRSSSETTRVYDRHGYDDEKLEALAKWEAHVRALVSVGVVDNVTPIRG